MVYQPMKNDNEIVELFTALLVKQDRQEELLWS